MFLPSKIVYKEIEMDHSDLSNYDEKCNIKFNPKNKEGVKEICKKSLRFIEKSQLWNTRNTSYDVCLQVNYWIYGKLASILGSDDTDNIEITFGSFQLVGKNKMNTRAQRTYNERCYPNFNIFKEKDWEKGKQLYEYYVNYSYLFSMAQIYADKCEFYEKINEIIPIYKYFESECSHGGGNCPDYYIKYKHLNPEKDLSKLKCYKQFQNERSLETEALAKVDSSNLPLVSQAGGGGHGLSEHLADPQK
ncbi:CYIR protein, partial [Plasmodium cynomolgi strain B]